MEIKDFAVARERTDEDDLVDAANRFRAAHAEFNAAAEELKRLGMTITLSSTMVPYKIADIVSLSKKTVVEY